MSKRFISSVLFNPLAQENDHLFLPTTMAETLEVFLILLF